MWRSRSTRRVSAWLGACLCVLLVAATPVWSGPAPARDADVQAQMQQVVEAVVGSTGDVAARIDSLAEMSGSRDTLLVQIALFLRDADGTEEAMTGAVMLRHLRFNDDEKIATVIPHLETGDAGLRRVLYDLLGTIDRPSGGEPDFGPYLPLLCGDFPPPGLVRYVYAVSPPVALRAMNAANPGARVSAGDREIGRAHV